jgi:hypothetical protein
MFVPVAVAVIAAASGASATPAAPAGPAARLRKLCFPGGQAPSATRTASVSTRSLPAAVGPVLAVTTSGQVWVLKAGQATRWTTASSSPASRYLWARWMPDGTILASRARVGATGGVVELDRFSGPQKRSLAASLPYSVRADAPDGYCPIEGHLATFAAVPAGVVLLRHLAGPLQHSCPVASAAGRWYCEKAEGYTLDLRTASLAPNAAFDSGRALVMGTPFVSADAAAADALIVAVGDTATIYDAANGGWNTRPTNRFSALSADGQLIARESSTAAVVSTPAGLLSAAGKELQLVDASGGVMSVARLPDDVDSLDARR